MRQQLAYLNGVDVEDVCRKPLQQLAGGTGASSISTLDQSSLSGLPWEAFCQIRQLDEEREYPVLALRVNPHSLRPGVNVFESLRGEGSS